MPTTASAEHQRREVRATRRGTAAGSSAGSRRCRPCPARRRAARRRRSGASAPASGSQVWNGKSGALIANARKKPRNSQLLHAGRDVELAQRVEVEGAVAQLAVAHHVQADDRGQHEQAADQAVQEELHRRVLPARAAEAPDEEVHRDEHRLEEDVEQEDVGGGEDADHRRLEQQQPGEVGRHATAGRSTRRVVPGRQITTGTSTAISSSITSAMPSTPKVKRTPNVGIQAYDWRELEAGRRRRRRRPCASTASTQHDQATRQRQPAWPAGSRALGSAATTAAPTAAARSAPSRTGSQPRRSTLDASAALIPPSPPAGRPRRARRRRACDRA